jgi:hypothetical protein
MRELKNTIRAGFNLKIVLSIVKNFSKNEVVFYKISHPGFFANGEVLLQLKNLCI